jgi:hypothetical protein
MIFVKRCVEQNYPRKHKHICEVILDTMWKVIDGKTVQPVSPKAFVRNHEGIFNLYETEKGTKYYMNWNGKLKKWTTESIITEAKLKEKLQAQKDRAAKVKECQNEKCKNNGLRGKDRIRCLRSCGM